MINILPVNANDGYVEGYTRKDGTYVQGYYRNESSSVKFDNYSTKENYNSYSAKTRKFKSNSYKPYKYKPVKYKKYF